NVSDLVNTLMSLLFDSMPGTIALRTDLVNTLMSLRQPYEAQAVRLSQLELTLEQEWLDGQKVAGPH
ncbi:hypothetical protein BWI97_26355, partial [Siphonobacter sp. BAB-5405]|uniref:hypothetical protein n=1 Tax=Siphonobacter sp. BAB-5405 TaxID=1864825 RepID=UPI000CC1F085